MAVTITDDNFDQEIIKSDIPVLLDFWAVWCGPCQMVAPILEKLSKDYEGKVKIGKLDVDANPQTAAKYGIMSIPAFKIFKNGQVVAEFVGAMGEEDMKAKIEEVL